MGQISVGVVAMCSNAISVNLHSKMCLYTSVCGSPFEILKRQIFRNGGSSQHVQ